MKQNQIISLYDAADKRRDSSVGIATDYGLNCRGSIPGMGKIFSSRQHPDWPWDPSSLLSNEYQGFFPRRVKRQGRETDHSPPYSAWAKESGAKPPIPDMSSWHYA
jgi:hypothetical protein